jgi:fumarate hydratase class I
VSGQYSLPCELPGLARPTATSKGAEVRAARGARRQAAAAAGILGVGVGGDRASGYELAKAQLMRPLDDVNPEPTLARLESEIVSEANTLGIGTMGFGGRVSLLGCKIGTNNRLPASFFVTVAYSCWALRRYGVALDAHTGAIKRWLYWDAPRAPMLRESRAAHRRRDRARYALSADAARRLRVGDVVL